MIFQFYEDILLSFNDNDFVQSYVMILNWNNKYFFLIVKILCLTLINKRDCYWGIRHFRKCSRI